MESEMKERNYFLAGGLSIINAVVFLLFIFNIAGWEDYNKPFPVFMKILFNIAVILSHLYCFYMLKVFINERFEVHKTDKWIVTLVLTLLAAVIIKLSGDLFHLTGKIDDKIVFVLFVLSGFSQVIFSINLFKIKEEHFGLLRPFAFISFVCGICILLINVLDYVKIRPLVGVVFFLSIVVIIVYYTFLGIIFFKAKEGAEFV